jgi:thiamine biosynthesis protein ThiS
MQLNGQAYPYTPGLTLHAVIAQLGLKHDAIVVMRGQDIYKKGRIPDVQLEQDDVVEIVRMMQGG